MAFALCAVACVDRAVPGIANRERDVAVALADAPPLALAVRPIQRFGGVQSDPDLELNARNGLLTAVFTADGGIAAVDASRLLRFTADGRLVGAFGQEGSGPRESRLLGSICRTPDDSREQSEDMAGATSR